MVIHKTTAFKEPEIEGAFDALAGVAEIECVEVSSASCWRGVWLIKSGVEKPAVKTVGVSRAPRDDGDPHGQFCLGGGGGQCSRGFNQGRLLSGQEEYTAPSAINSSCRQRAARIDRSRGAGLDQDGLEQRRALRPSTVSIRYSQKLARTIANVPDLPRNVYPYRLFM